jgi:hypothetical protein
MGGPGAGSTVTGSNGAGSSIVEGPGMGEHGSTNGAHMVEQASAA